MLTVAIYSHGLGVNWLMAVENAHDAFVTSALGGNSFREFKSHVLEARYLIVDDQFPV